MARALWLWLPWLVWAGCQPTPRDTGTDDFFERQNAAHGGDYLGTYPLHNPDSCILRLQAEVPAPLQPWGCLSLWYHLPREPMANSFRMLELYERHYPHDTVSGFAQIMRAEFYVNLARFDSAALCLNDAYKIYTRLKKPLELSDVKLLEGRMELYRNNTGQALDALFDALNLLNGHDTTFSERHAILYHDISVVYERAKMKDEHRAWLMALQHADLDRLDKPWVHRVRVATGMAFSFLGTLPDSSLLWAEQAVRIFQEQLQTPTPPRLSYILGRAHTELGACQEALPHLEAAYAKRPSAREVFGHYQYPLALGKCLLCLGRLHEAEAYLTEALVTPDTGNLAIAHELLGRTYARQGLYQKAWEAESTSHRLDRAKFTADRIKATADADARYETAQKAHRIAQLERQQRISRQQMLIGTLTGLLLLLLALARHQRQRQRAKLLTQENLLLQQDRLVLIQKRQLAEANERLKAQALSRSKAELAGTKAELNDVAKLLALKNQLIADLEARLATSHTDRPDTPGKEGQGALETLKILTKDDWLAFTARFEAQFPGFLGAFEAQYPALTAAETRLFLLLKMGLDAAEISGILGISRNSVWRSRHRLGKKLALPETADLDGFIADFRPLVEA